jgi:hypothetical protein
MGPPSQIDPGLPIAMILPGTEALVRSIVLLSACVTKIVGVDQRVLVAKTMEVVQRHRQHLYFSRAQQVRVQLLRG